MAGGPGDVLGDRHRTSIEIPDQAAGHPNDESARSEGNAIGGPDGTTVPVSAIQRSDQAHFIKRFRAKRKLRRFFWPRN